MVGDIPSKWKVSRVKFFSILNPSKSQLKNISLDTEVTFLPMEAIGEQGELDTSKLKQLKDVVSGYTYIGEGDVCIAKITPCFENGKGAVVKGLKNGIVFATTEVIPFRCFKQEDSKYLYYLLTSEPFTKIAEGSMYGAGGQKRVSDNFVGNYHFSEPPTDERTQIANFLDHETAKIDTLIEKQQQLIKLLKEKRQAIISHAVTKGLNPNALMRDSGVEWLGEVPEHWKVCRIKQVAKLESGHTPDKKIEAYWMDCNIPWVSLNDSSQLKEVDYISDTAIFLNEKGINSSARKLPGRCVVFTRDASIGLAAITTRIMAVSQHVIAWVCDEEKVIPKYLLLVFYAMKDELDRFTFGATLKTIGMPDVNKLTGAFPDITEQKIIIEHVFQVKQTLDILVSKAEEAIKIILIRKILQLGEANLPGVARWWPQRRVDATEASQDGSAG